MKYVLAVLLLLAAPTTSLALNSQEQRWVDAVRNTYGDRAGRRVETWRQKMSDYSGLSESEKLTRVNNFFNQLNFVNDDQLWGKNDYWRPRLSSLAVTPAIVKTSLSPSTSHC
jgi:predicted transglutaminase-like cysteine proteinase